MDWIERWIGVSPDGGDGSLELLLTLVTIAVAVVAILAVNARARGWCLGLVSAAFEKVLRKQ